MNVYLLDGTYELFRHFFAIPSRTNAAGREVAATRGVLTSVVMMLESGVSHLGVATDHVIESFRNQMWPGYKSGAGIDPKLLQQFPLLEDGLRALGVATWPMVELEADDGLAAAARSAAASEDVEHVYICSPDKDLAQCVVEDRVLLLDRRKQVVAGVEGVIARFGVPPASIPDYLALVGDSADGFPGLPGWGAKATAAVLSRYGHIEDIPAGAGDWDVNVRGAERLALALRDQMELALLFRDLATLRDEQPLFQAIDDLRWTGPTADLEAICAEIDGDTLLSRVALLAKARAATAG